MTLQDVCIQNSYQGVIFQGDGHSVFRDCKFVGNVTDLALLADEADISGCTFELTATVAGSQHVWSHHQDRLTIVNCNFHLRESGRTGHISCYGNSANIKNCEFYQGGQAVSTLCDSISISGCLFDGQSENGVRVHGGDVFLQDSVFRNQLIALSQVNSSGALWNVQRIVIEEASYASLFYRTTLEGFITDSILAKGSEFVAGVLIADKSQNEVNSFNMTNNWWGTADPDSIQAWIYDWNDNENLGTVIDWADFKSEPVAVEKQSLGGLKSMFR